jgi:hypothetical protein
MGHFGHGSGRAAGDGRAGPPAAGPLRRARAGPPLAFGLVGAVYFTWAARLSTIKADLELSDGQLAVALIGLEAGALIGLQVGGILVPRTSSRAALTVALPVLTAAAFVLAAAVNVATVAMNAMASPSSSATAGRSCLACTPCTAWAASVAPASPPWPRR